MGSSCSLTQCSADLGTERRMMAPKAAVLATTLSLPIVIYAGARWYKLSHYPQWLVTVAKGDSREIVERKMGTPDAVQSKPHWLWCNAPECETEYLYGHSMPPQWWVVGFDRAGRAVWIEELQSP